MVGLVMRISDASGKMRISDADVEARLGGRKDRYYLYLGDVVV